MLLVFIVSMYEYILFEKVVCKHNPLLNKIIIIYFVYIVDFYLKYKIYFKFLFLILRAYLIFLNHTNKIKRKFWQ